MRARQHDQLVVKRRSLDDRWHEAFDFFLWNQSVQVGIKGRILWCKGRVVGTNAPIYRTGCNVRLDFLVQLEVVLLGQNVDLGTGRFFPFGNARIQRFILLTANELGVNCNAFKFARKFRSPRRNHTQRKQD
ncbi:hypothetical protein D9M69_467800 [compost metagenome]